ncbi:MAG: hypothetical protein Q4G40_09195 [Brachybacterium sp.]|nr:hypothetical protein [Brachybacterium sp.]
METITYTTGTYYGETTEQHIWTITDEDGTAAELYVSIEDQEIMNIEVREDRRGEGLARALYETADEQLGGIFHAPAEHCTPEGLAFAEAMGGDVLDYCTNAEHCACTLALAA